jgi:hypothetical protein
MSTDIHDLLINFFGGISVAILDRSIIFLNKTFKNCKFKQIFGKDSSDFKIVYGKMKLKQKYIDIDKFPYLKPNTGVEFSISDPVSFAETRAAKYLSESYSKSVEKSPLLIADEEIRDKLDISYCSLGGYNNYKTIDIFQSKQNDFFDYNLGDPPSIIIKNDKQKVFIANTAHDYAVIIKINNRLFPNRTQICVAGLGEWGTSGGSWFLANKWKEIRKIVGNKNFGAVIKVKVCSDESAELIELIY